MLIYVLRILSFGLKAQLILNHGQRARGIENTNGHALKGQLNPSTNTFYRIQFHIYRIFLESVAISGES